MAKVNPILPGEPTAHGLAAVVEEGPTPAGAAPPNFRVTLHSHTPIAHPTLVVAADTEEEARQKFCAANGISGSDCEWKVEKTDDPVTDLKAKK